MFDAAVKKYVSGTIDSYITQKSWRVAENSNSRFSFSGLQAHLAGAMISDYMIENVYPKEIGNAHTDGDFHIHDMSHGLVGYCFTGDTKVKLLDGKSRTFEELVKYYKDEKFWVYSIDENHNIVAGLAHSPRKTRKDTEIIIVELDNGELIKCTPDHKFMLRDGTYREAQHLEEKDSLMPLYESFAGNYLRVQIPAGGRKYTHRAIAEYIYGDLSDKTIHHLNGIKTDNRPENLSIMEDTEHRKKEIIKTMSTDKWKESNKKRLQEYNKSEEKRLQIAKLASERLRNENGTFKNNHKVMAIYKTGEKEDVYDLTVEKYHNFALDAGVFVHNCAGWSLKKLLEKGFSGVQGKISASPAKHLNAILGQIVNFFGTLQNEWAGAQAFSSFDTYLAPFVRADKLTYEEVEQCLQEFIFSINQTSRWGNQVPFTNLTFDLKCPDDMKDEEVLVGGKKQKDKYGDFQKEMDMVNLAFINLMIKGDSDGRIFTFPIPTYNITKDFDWENEISQRLFFMTAKYGTPYFQNFINSTLQPSDVRSMCPITGDTRVVVKSQQKGVTIKKISDVYSCVKNKGTEYEVWTPEGWSNGIPTKQKKQKIYEWTLSNGFKIKLGENHLQPVKNEIGKDHTLKIKDIKVEDKYWIPFSKKGWDSRIGDWKTGVIIGAYLGDGSIEDNILTFSLSVEQKDNETENYIKTFFNNLGYSINITHTEKNVRFVKVNGRLKEFIKRYVKGDNALTKELTRHVFNSSESFRKGVIYGLRLTDGARDCNRIYTSSPKLARGITELLASVGRKGIQNYEDNREERFGTNTNYRVDYPNRERYGNLFNEDKDYHYFKIKEIKEVNEDLELYCFEIDNYDNLFTLASGMITHNCRLQLDVRALRHKTGGLFGSGEQTGSVGVVTINLPRIGYTNKGNEEKLFKRLSYLMDGAMESLEIKRKLATENIERGLVPYTKEYLGDLSGHFSTIGLLGMHECLQNFFGDKKKGILSKEGRELGLKILSAMREKLSEYQEKTGNIYNLEATPAEGASYRLAKHDKKKYKDIITAGTEDEPYYTNSSQLPVQNGTDIFEALEHQDEFQCKYNGGTVFHGFIGERINDWRTARNLVKKVAEKFKLPYFTVTPTFSICSEHGYISGEHFKCPLDNCKGIMEVYSRVVGYFRPVQNWNIGKTREYKERRTFIIDK